MDIRRPPVFDGPHEDTQDAHGLVAPHSFLTLGEESMKTKATIREDMRKLRQAKHFKSPHFLENFKKNFTLQPHDVLALYYPREDEVDTIPFIEYAMAKGASVALPLLHGDLMEFHLWDGRENLADGKYGIKEPTSGHKIEPTIILTPLLAFDRVGYRIGYGKGHYDMAIAEFDQKARPLIIGLGFGFQEVEFVPHDAHDQRMDFVITEREVIKT